MTLDTKALRALAQAAAPGPWRAELAHASIGRVWRIEYTATDEWNGSASFSVATVDGYPGNFDSDSANAAYIAALSPSTALALLDEIDRLRALLGEACDLADYFDDGYGEPGRDEKRDRLAAIKREGWV